MKSDIVVFLENLSNFRFDLNLTSMTGTLHQDQLTFMKISRLLLFRMISVLDKSCRENQITFGVE